ncbi:endonuclease MutS2 [Leptolyngbya sp. PCC 6406]|uniref:endonuclease MutS2 n=1 Tax=Leptolyngbya sp. PCC 6406 TaxID=1173264 RepID=UPI0002AC617F|nr:endonuclease MutS2 [Leptolyngbya sp. PCC 6406]
MIQAETLALLEWPRLCQHLATFTATKLGAIAARQLPLPTTQAESEGLLAQTREATQLETRPPGLKFAGIQDIGESLERAVRQGLLGGEELLAIATTVNGARQLRRAIDGQDAVPVLQGLVADLRTYPELEQSIHHCIDDRAQVTDRASPKLGGLRTQIKQCRSEIYAKLQRILQRQSGAIQEAVITQRGDRFVIPVKAPQKDAIPGIVHDASTSGATLYVEPHSIVEMGNRLRQLQRQEKTEEEAICRALTAQVAAVATDLERLLAIVTALDLAAARARYGLWLQGNAPQFITPGEQTTLRHLRHPLLWWQHHHEAGPEVVPIDVVVNPRLRVVAITGPNTGGKTVTLKTLGLAALMAKAGMYVPAKEPVELPWFDQVLADIGDEQSIEQSLSTFSGHIKRISRVLAALETEGNALVLLDEVGAGTDPSEGSALAIALLRYLADQARFTVATTHYGELKALKYQDDRFENASVEFDENTLSPTYRLLWGIPGRSNALTIARRLGLAAEIVDQAQNYVGLGSGQDVNQVIAGLEAQRQQQETKAAAAAALLAETEKLHAEVSRKAAFLKERERELQQQQQAAVQAAVTEARAEIAQVIRRLQQGEPTAQSAQKATAAVAAIAARHRPAPPPKPVGFRPRVGDRLRIPSLGQTAEVLTDPDGDGKFAVRFGIMKMTVSLEDVESLQGEKAELPAPKPPAPDPTPPPPAPAIRTSNNTFDLRGMRVHEAEALLEDAIASALGPIWIIHGHGTGKLRRGVQEFLQHHPQIQRFEPADQADGGTGVTIAYP